MKNNEKAKLKPAVQTTHLFFVLWVLFLGLLFNRFFLGLLFLRLGFFALLLVFLPNFLRTWLR